MVLVKSASAPYCRFKGATCLIEGITQPGQVKLFHGDGEDWSKSYYVDASGKWFVKKQSFLANIYTVHPIDLTRFQCNAKCGHKLATPLVISFHCFITYPLLLD